MSGWVDMGNELLGCLDGAQDMVTGCRLLSKPATGTSFLGNVLNKALVPNLAYPNIAY